MPFGRGGTVFSIIPPTGFSELILHSFGCGTDGANPGAGLTEVNGTLYGTTGFGGAYCVGSGGCGTVFSITTGGTEKVLHSFGYGTDGSDPSGLLNVKGSLYGTTNVGGKYGKGTVFSITTGGTEKVLHSFGSGVDGSFPSAGLIDVNGILYATTSSGGKYVYYGTVFSIMP